MKVGDVLINNCFNGRKELYLFACDIINGEIAEGDFLIIGCEKIRISSIDGQSIDFPSSVLLGIIKKQNFPTKIYEMYDKIFEVHRISSGLD